MKGILYIVIFFSLLKANEFKDMSTTDYYEFWKYFDFKNIKETPKIQQEDIDFKNTLNDLLAKTLENNNGIDKTDGNLDFDSENIKITNLSSIYEGESSSLFFQKELFISSKYYNYSGGLINRYERDNLILGVNGFIDKQKEQEDTKSFGVEFGYSHFIKAYSNYYLLNELENNLQFGMNFIIPIYTAFVFDISKDDSKINYKMSYSPYNAFNLNLLRLDYNTKEAMDDIVVQLGFSFNFSKDFSKQLKRKDNTIKELNRYDFLQRIY